MAAVRNEIRKFYNELVGTFEKPLVRDLKKIADARSKLNEFEKARDNVRGIEEEIKDNDSNILNAKENVEKLNGEIDEVKKSDKYVSRLKIVGEIDGLRAGIDSEIGRLKGLIDFKKLIGIIHSNDRELGIVKEYRDHFVSEFSKDDGKKLLNLLEGCNMKSEDIDAKVSLVGEKRVELAERVEAIGVDVTVAKFDEMKRIDSKIEGMEIAGVKDKRRLEEYELKLDKLRNGVVGLIEEFGVKVV